MEDKNINRRQMNLNSPATVLSTMVPVEESGETERNGLTENNALQNSGRGNEVCFINAVDMAAALRSKKISARELMEAHLRQISVINPAVNAIITRIPDDQLMTQALEADEAIVKGKSNGPLHGLPIAVKDLFETKGIRTTYGSPLWKDFIPEQDELIVERQKKAGAIILGKTNVPELGMGSQTFNPLFGPTYNPYDLSKTCGGSTGGGAVALACGMTPLADGSDMGGSLRNPAGFCNVVGLRPSPGRVPLSASKLAWTSLSVNGPMARTVSDCAFLLSVQAGPDPHSPISIMESPQQFMQSLTRHFKGVKIAFIKGLGLPWEKEVMDTFVAQKKVFESLGCIVEENEPDLSDAYECFVNLRHWQFEAQYGDLYYDNAHKMNTYTKWHIEEGRKLSGPFLSRLEIKRSALFRRMQIFLKEYEFLIMPVSQVLPFDVNKPYPTEIEGVPMLTYLDWMKSSFYISITGNPALSVPCTFSQNGLPVGIQIVGRYNADFNVLQMGYAFEQATKAGNRRPGILI